VDIDCGVVVPRSKLALIRAKTASQMVRNLMEVVFTAEEMRRSTVTGRSKEGNMDVLEYTS
jgi:chromosome segregation and condensation protein ScpB